MDDGAIPLPTAQPARDPIADPWVGDLWCKGDRGRQLTGFYRYEKCTPYRSYGRTLEHRYIHTRDPSEATHMGFDRLIASHLLKRPHVNLLDPGGDGVSFFYTTKAKTTPEKWRRWLRGASLERAGPHPNPPAPLHLAEQYGVLTERHDGDRTTWTFEWGSIVAERNRRRLNNTQALVFLGEIQVALVPKLSWGTTLPSAYYVARGIMLGLEVDEGHKALIRQSWGRRQVVRPSFRRGR